MKTVASDKCRVTSGERSLANARVGLEIAPLEEAVSRMNAKTPIARALTSAEWADVPLALRERAFWTARFAKADVLQVMHDAIGDRLSMTPRESVPGRGEVTMSRDNFMVEMRDRLEAAGYVPPQGKAGTIQDLTSKGRLGLIFDTNTQMAQEYARWKSGQLPGALDAFPCQELIREEDRKVPRNWIERWRGAGGQFYDGRMMAAKDDPIWTEISAFGTPWPPFDFNSGMGTRDISSSEAERLGVIKPGAVVAPPQVEFNAKLEKSVEGYAPEIVEDALADFGGGVQVQDGKARMVETPVAEAPPEISVAEARAALEKGFEVADSEGQPVVFGRRVLEYFDKAEGGKDDRLKSLPWAVEAVKSGTKSVLEDRVVYTMAFLGDTGKPKGALTLASRPGGEVWNFYKKPAKKLVSAKPGGSARSAPAEVEPLPAPTQAEGTIAPGGGEVKR
jgi:hypothetical protein